jgi:putative ABC transport system permease protein
MRTPLAWLNLLHQKGRSLVAATGVAFAVVLIFMQLGFYGAAESTATIVYDELNFDVLLASARYIDFYRPGAVPRSAALLPLGVPGVRKVMPLYVGFALWRNPDAEGPGARQRRRMMVLGFDLTEPVFRRGRRDIPVAVARHREELQKPDHILVDRLSRREFGDLEEDMRRGGIETELGARRVTVAGLFTLGTGFGIDGEALCSDTNLFAILGGAPPDQVTLGLVLLERGASAEQVATELRKVLPPDVQALTRQDIAGRERHHWISNTSVGIIFTLGVFVAFGVGVVFVYQVISTDVRSRLNEYATLKALGYTMRYLSGVILRQALLLAVAGYLPGLAVSLALYALARGATGIPIGMNLQRGLVVLVLATAMCGLSGLLALQKVRTADPADLF